MKRLALLTLSCALAAASACAGTGAKDNPLGGDGLPSGDGTGDPPLPPPRNPDINNDEAGAFGVGKRGKDAGPTGENDAASRSGDAATMPDATAAPDASEPPDASPPPDASVSDSATVGNDTGTVGPDTGTVVPADACAGTGALSAGDLAVVEFMIASQVALGDTGEWLELQSTRACSLNLKGLHFVSPRAGGGADTLDIATDVWLRANGIFVVANSADAMKNHSLPSATLFTWTGGPADVLDNGGDSVVLTAGGVTVTSFSYPAFQTIYAGRSISFPSDCAWSDLPSWARWSFSFHVWTTNFVGTPNADNTDVACY